MKCENCNEPFDHSDHRPRCLECGHSMCSLCIARLLESNEGKFMCPLCTSSRESAASRVSDFPVNLTVLKMIKAKDPIQKEVSAPDKSKFNPFPVKETHLNQLQSNFETKKQNTIEGLQECINSCNNKLENHKKITKDILLEKEGLDAKKKELQLELENIKTKRKELHSKAGLHESKITDIQDLKRKLGDSLHSIKKAKSDLVLTLAAQEIVAFKGRLQELEDSSPQSMDIHSSTPTTGLNTPSTSTVCSTSPMTSPITGPLLNMIKRLREEDAYNSPLNRTPNSDDGPSTSNFLKQLNQDRSIAFTPKIPRKNEDTGFPQMASWTSNSQLELPAFLDGYNVVCRNDYSGDRELYWDLPFISCIFKNVSNNKITMKRAADILGVPQTTLYGRYKKYKKNHKKKNHHHHQNHPHHLCSYQIKGASIY
ncbi:unnamed protein product [Meganyctiphanes norvegica]|uniref:RING-type domain-containing protein n=1 Tax=Meganyctiphanes norvegica TaxID=48144 RepID=A0AAV2QJ72_MEGNR